MSARRDRTSRAPGPQKGPDRKGAARHLRPPCAWAGLATMMAWPTAALADADCAFPTACFEDEPCEESRLELSLKTLRLEGASSDITILTRRDEAFGLQPIAEGDAAVRTLGGVTASGFHLLTISTEDHDRYTTHFFDGPTSLTYLGIYEAS